MLSQLHCESTPHRPFLMAGGIRAPHIVARLLLVAGRRLVVRRGCVKPHSRGPPAGIRWYFLEAEAVLALPFDRHPQEGRRDRSGAVARVLFVEQGFQLSLKVVLPAVR